MQYRGPNTEGDSHALLELGKLTKAQLEHEEFAVKAGLELESSLASRSARIKQELLDTEDARLAVMEMDMVKTVVAEAAAAKAAGQQPEPVSNQPCVMKDNQGKMIFMNIPERKRPTGSVPASSSQRGREHERRAGTETRRARSAAPRRAGHLRQARASGQHGAGGALGSRRDRTTTASP